MLEISSPNCSNVAPKVSTAVVLLERPQAVIDSLFIATIGTILGCYHSSVDSSVPSILPPQVWVSSTPSIFLINNFQIVYLSFELKCEKNENK